MNKGTSVYFISGKHLQKELQDVLGLGLQARDPCGPGGGLAAGGRGGLPLRKAQQLLASHGSSCPNSDWEAAQISISISACSEGLQ